MITKVSNLEEARKVIQTLETRVEELEEKLIKTEEYYNTDPVVVLDYEQWMDCWRNMCNDLNYVPAWCDYPKYFKCVSCNSTNDSGLIIEFKTPEEAMAFKLEWS